LENKYKKDNKNDTKKFYRQLAFAVFAALTPHHQPSPKNGLRHFSALPTHHPTSEQDNEMLDKKSRILVNLFQYKIDSVVQNYFEAEKSKKKCNFAFYFE